jgi:hypothetical protein
MAGISKAERERRAASKDAPQATITALPYVESDQAYLQALCAALPFSGRQADAFTPLTFKDRLAGAVENADKILRAVAARGGE